MTVGIETRAEHSHHPLDAPGGGCCDQVGVTDPEWLERGHADRASEMDVVSDGSGRALRRRTTLREQVGADVSGRRRPHRIVRRLSWGGALAATAAFGVGAAVLI